MSREPQDTQESRAHWAMIGIVCAILFTLLMTALKSLGVI